MAESIQNLSHLREIDFAEIHDCEFVGRGSFGTVYKARFQNHDVAVKEFDLNADRRSIETEVKQLSRVEHPNIIALYGVSVCNAVIYLIMEYAEGGSLYNFLHGKAKPYYTAAHAMSWARQCAEGVAYLHAMKPKALIHRDLKPPNLLLVNNGRNLKICDFGTVADKSTLMTNNKGSAAWMAPEVFETSSYTEKCDVFSWGIILWEVLSRQQPFKDVGYAFTIMWKVHKGHRPPMMDACPRPIANLITSCWDQNPLNRPSMEDVVQTMTTLCRFFAGSDLPLVYSNPLQAEYDDEEPIAIVTSADDTIDNNQSNLDTWSSTSEVTPTNSQRLQDGSDLFLTQSTIGKRSPSMTNRSATDINRWGAIPEEGESQYINTSKSSLDADPFRMTPSAQTIRRMEIIQNGMQRGNFAANLPNLSVDVDPNAWDLDQENERSIFGNISKSDGKERLSVTETKPVHPDEEDSTTEQVVDDDDQSLHLMLEPELQPEMPLANNRVSQEIYQEHTKLAKEYLRVDTELYYATDKRNKLLATMGPEERENKQLLIKKAREKEELLEFYNDLKQQLEQMQNNQRLPTSQDAVPDGSSAAPTEDDGWVFISQNHQS